MSKSPKNLDKYGEDLVAMLANVKASIDFVYEELENLTQISTNVLSRLSEPTAADKPETAWDVDYLREREVPENYIRMLDRDVLSRLSPFLNANLNFSINEDKTLIVWGAQGPVFSEDLP